MLLQRRDFQIGVSKSRIAQTETERIQFADDACCARTVWTGMRVSAMRTGFEREVQLYLSYALRESHCQFATRIMLAKQSLRNHRSPLTTRKPRLQDGWDISICPVDGERLPVYQHQYHRLSRCMQCLK